MDKRADKIEKEVASLRAEVKKIPELIRESMGQQWDEFLMARRSL